MPTTDSCVAVARSWFADDWNDAESQNADNKDAWWNLECPQEVQVAANVPQYNSSDISATDWLQNISAPVRPLADFESYIPTPKTFVEDKELTASQRLAILSEQFEYSDWELQDFLDGRPPIINHSSLTLEEHKKGLCEVAFPDPKRVWCGRSWNNTALKASAAIMTRYINIRDIPIGYSTKKRGWVYHSPELPTCMPFDVDEYKAGSLFPKLFHDLRCYQLFDAYPDLPRPATITVNPISLNAHYLYLIYWTDKDRANIPAALERYHAICLELTLLFGADIEYQHNIIRSPYHMEGRHRAKPRQKTGSKKKTDISEEAPYHNAILYDLNGYTLDDLEALANQLRAILGPEKVALALSALENKATILETTNNHEYAVPKVATKEHPVIPAEKFVQDSKPAKRKKKRTKSNGPVKPRKFPMEEQIALAAIPIHKITTNFRDKGLLAHLSLNFCRRAHIAQPFRDASDYEGFLAYATTKALELYEQIEDKRDFPVSKAYGRARSVVKYCMSDNFRPFGLTSEQARELANRRWKNHGETLPQKLTRLGITKYKYYQLGLHKEVDEMAQDAPCEDAPYVFERVSFNEQRAAYRVHQHFKVVQQQIDQLWAKNDQRTPIGSYKQMNWGNTPLEYASSHLSLTDTPDGMQARGPPS